MPTAKNKTDKVHDVPADEIIKVGGDTEPVEKGGADKPFVSAKESKAETILAGEARPLESEISTDPNNESETQFLNRLMLMQREGGWGNHLTPAITERIKRISGTYKQEPGKENEEED